HAVRPTVNVIAASAPRGNDNPAASSNVSHSPVNFYLKLGEAYRSSGRRSPIFDTVGHNPYPVTNAERPWIRHPTTPTIAAGDDERLVAVPAEASNGTGQPPPGEGRVSIWYREEGFQTTTPTNKASLYRGTESISQTPPPFFTRVAAGLTTGPAPDQATQL